MRKKTILRAIAIVTCLSILSLSVPTIANARDIDDKFPFRAFLFKQIRALIDFFPFLQIDNTKDTETPELNQSTVTKTNEELPEKLKKITGTVSSVKRPDDD